MGSDILSEIKLCHILAVVAAEMFSFLYFDHRTPWGTRYMNRYFISSLLSDGVLVLLVQFVIKNYFPVYGPEEAVKIGLFFVMLYVGFEGPHVNTQDHNLKAFFFKSLHRFLLIVIIAFILHHFKDMKL